MTVLHKEDWQAWHDEIKHYAKRETQGLTRDLEALEAHIKKLREVAPKDSAGCRHTDALSYLNSLQLRLDGVKSYLSRV
ncbi:unnamed protein product [marine sediment metagenome]|uniref:Uncharacterized protein n=1 Tax=marine sediment metagenome TaxID=412755 RepID=X1LGU7_9ZZZZ